MFIAWISWRLKIAIQFTGLGNQGSCIYIYTRERLNPFWWGLVIKVSYFVLSGAFWWGTLEKLNAGV